MLVLHARLVSYFTVGQGTVDDKTQEFSVCVMFYRLSLAFLTIFSRFLRAKLWSSLVTQADHSLASLAEPAERIEEAEN